MCGIIGILGKEPVVPSIVEALKRLEYRGYDSAGIATLEAGRRIGLVRAEGKLIELQKKLAETHLLGETGIGHTRWATHGKANETNAHPHATNNVALVHNGIIENFHVLKERLMRDGVVFSTQTDSEVIVHLLDQELKKGHSPSSAVYTTLRSLEGAFALAVIFKGHSDLMIGARRGNPLAIGHGDGEMYLGTDATALAPFTNRITYLEDGDWTIVTRGGAKIYDSTNTMVERPMKNVVVSDSIADKGGYSSFMEKEVREQPMTVLHTFSHYLNFSSSTAVPPVDFAVDWNKLDQLSIVACGTAYLAGRVAQYWFELLAQLDTKVDIASEFRYREPPLSKNGLSLVISQSGETADTLAALRYSKKAGRRVAAIVNNANATMVREADFFLPTLAGQEIGVAATKTLTSQLAALLSLAIAAGRARGVLNAGEEATLVKSCAMVPALISKVLGKAKEIQAIAKHLNGTEHALFLGRGYSDPIAFEGALKLKELSYIHAEGYPAGELKHGPIALVDKNMPVIVIAPRDRWIEKTASNLQEVAARDGRIILLTDIQGRHELGKITGVEKVLTLPDMPEVISPLVYVVALQLLAFYSAEYRGKNVDQPRNLAKSVTVE